MALIKCNECNGMVSDKAAVCPHCGCPVIMDAETQIGTITKVPTQKQKAKKRVVAVVLVVLVAMVFVSVGMFFLTNQLSDEEKIQVQLVYDKIQIIGKISYSSGDKIEQAEAEFNRLNEKCKRHVDNKDTLVAARDQYDTLLADAVKKKIDNIGTVNLSSEKGIAAARSSYEDLSEAQKGRVSNYEVLIQAEITLDALQVENCMAAIQAIGTVDLNSKEKIDAANKNYQGLTKEQQTRVTNYVQLQDADNEYSKISINHCVELIDAIGEVSLESKIAIENAEAAYENLSAPDRKEIVNYSVLRDSRQKYDELKEAKEKAERKEDVQNTIRVTKLKCDEPNSAGGVDVYINFTNKSEKTIKYATFKVIPYNAVGDVVKCEIRASSYAYLSDTGPYKKGQGNSGGRYWSTIWYNSTITSIKLLGIEIEYTDGTIVKLDEADMEYVMY